jgi:hypothetical protein
MLRDLRREEARREARRARRRARLEVVRLQRELEAEDRDPILDDRWPFACALWCGVCGALAFPAEHPPDHPLRRAISAQPHDRPACAACRHHAWTDLACKPLARAIVDAEVFERELGNEMRSSGLRHAGAAAVLGGFGGLCLWASAPAFVGFLPCVGLVASGLALTRLIRALSSVRDRGTEPTRPRRWFMAPRPRAPSIWRRAAVPQGEPLRAPLTGRPCLAYEVSVAWDGATPDDPRGLALVEQRVAGIRVGVEPLPPLRTHLRLDRDVVTIGADLSDEARLYLRSRGLDPGDGAFTYREAILEIGAPVDVLRTDDRFELRHAAAEGARSGSAR